MLGRTLHPSHDFRVRQAMMGWREVRATNNYFVRAETDIDGVTYRAAAIEESPTHFTAVLVGSDGRTYPRLLAGSRTTTGEWVNVLMTGSATFEPASVTFVPGAEEVTIDTRAGFVNFELLYGGTDGRSFTLTYREYTPDNLLKPSFTQVLTYPNESRTVRFQRIALEIRAVTGEALSYVVTADDRSAP